ncbi:hypothetical protein ElyMa_002603100 [Elysia marginata]|uniref:Uncharacterized protein n=1 Tax=Elysia marginata TaxID=1093978 RepID=A0AAV4H1F1_9GAST|nr:hypothetical protein ElyMa_002603100 [Elysia marginata]
MERGREREAESRQEAEGSHALNETDSSIVRLEWGIKPGCRQTEEEVALEMGVLQVARAGKRVKRKAIKVQRLTKVNPGRCLASPQSHQSDENMDRPIPPTWSGFLLHRLMQTVSIPCKYKLA